MELRMQPAFGGPQTLRSFQILTSRAPSFMPTDHLGNAVYHFNLLREHEELRIEPRRWSRWERCRPVPSGWMRWMGRYNNYNLRDDQFDMLGPSKFARLSPELAIFMKIAELESRKAIRLPR